MSEGEPNLDAIEYDDGVVCFGPLTESQLERYERLPRHTVLPSDIKLSQSFMDNDEDEGNDQSTMVLYESKEHTSILSDNSINVTLNEEETDLKLKQSANKDSPTVFSSPHAAEFIPSARFIDTEVINRCIRMGSLSSNESFSDHDKSILEGETVSDIDNQEVEITPNNSMIYNDASSCEQFSVSSVIEQNDGQGNVQDVVNNICTLKHCNEDEDKDISICNNSELGDDGEDSIVTDEYSVTPGKQRLFDLRLAKPSFRPKTFVTSAPFMDRIEETATPVVPKTIDSPLILTNNVSSRQLVVEENLDLSTGIICNMSAIYSNQTSNERELESSKLVNETEEIIEPNVNASDVGHMSGSEISKYSVSESDLENCLNDASSVVINMEVEPAKYSVTVNNYENELLNETTCENSFSVAKSIVRDDNVPSKVMNETLIDTLNLSKPNVDAEKSMNILYNTYVSTVNISDVDGNDNSKSENMNADITSNTSNGNNIFDSTACTNKHSIYNNSMHFNEINQSEETVNITEHIFDTDISINNVYNLSVSTPNLSGDNSDIKSKTTEMEILSDNTSVMGNNFNDSLSETNLTETGNKIDISSSINNASMFSVPSTDLDNYKKSETMEAEIVSPNTSLLGNILNVSACTNKHSLNNKSIYFNEPSSETNKNEDPSIVTEYKFDTENAMENTTSMSVSMTDLNFYHYKEKSEVKVMESKSSGMDTIFDDTACTNNSINSEYELCKINQTREMLNVTEYTEKSTTSPININVSSTNDNNILDDYSKVSVSSEKNDHIYSNAISEMSDETENKSHVMRHYLEFEQVMYEMCNDNSSEGCNNKQLNELKYIDSQAQNNISEQTSCSETLNSVKIDNSFSVTDSPLRSNLSVIIENRTLEENSSDIMVQNENIENSINDLSNNADSKNIINENLDSELLNKSIHQNKSVSAVPEVDSKSEVIEPSVTNVTNEFEMETKLNDSILINNTNNDLGLIDNENTIKTIILNERMNETNVVDDCSILSDKFLKAELNISAKVENVLNNETVEQILISKDVKEIVSSQGTSNEKNFYEMSKQNNITRIPNFTTSVIQEVENNQMLVDQEQHVLLNNDIQQPNLLDVTKNINSSLEHCYKMEQMFNFEEDKKIKQFDCKTPKIEKLLDFSIVQQTPTFESQPSTQKLLNFSIVDQTPIHNKSVQKSLNENILKKDTLIDFSSIDQMWDLEASADNTIFEEGNKNSPVYSSNISKTSAPDMDLLDDESILVNSSNNSNLRTNQTLTESNVNQSYEMNKPKTDKSYENIEEKSVMKLPGNELVFLNKQIEIDEPCHSVNPTTEKVEYLDVSHTSELKRNDYYNQQCLKAATTKEVLHGKKMSLNNTINQECKNIDFIKFMNDSNQHLISNSDERAIMDFSIIEQPKPQATEFKNKENIKPVEFDNNASTNLIEMSVDVVTPSNKSDKPINVNSDDMNNTAIFFEESKCSHNNELLTDIQMDDVSLLMESGEKSSIGESFHSIELDHVQEDNKRKVESIQEYHNNEKKMKMETHEPKTPMSMLYKIKNMFRSSEKRPYFTSNMKENNLKSDKCYQKLNFGESKGNLTKPLSTKKSEVPIKSKIPCKVADKVGTPVLSDLSNSSSRKCPESRIPSKFQK